MLINKRKATIVIPFIILVLAVGIVFAITTNNKISQPTNTGSNQQPEIVDQEESNIKVDVTNLPESWEVYFKEGQLGDGWINNAKNYTFDEAECIKSTWKDNDLCVHFKNSQSYLFFNETDKVVVFLGTHETKSGNWDTYKATFKKKPKLCDSILFIYNNTLYAYILSQGSTDLNILKSLIQNTFKNPNSLDYVLDCSK